MPIPWPFRPEGSTPRPPPTTSGAGTLESVGLLEGLGLADKSLNMLTLGGIAAAMGLVIDDKIVVVEHLAPTIEESSA